MIISIKSLRLLLAAAFCLLGLAACQEAIPLAGPLRITKVSDGDTVQVESLGSVRLIGIDTPEKFQSDKLQRQVQETGLTAAVIQAEGKRASEFTHSLLDGRSVYVENDVQSKDKYGRGLVYLYLEDNNGDFTFGNRRFKQANLEIVRAGFAQPLTIPPNVRYAEQFTQAAQQARAQKRGLWRNSQPALQPSYANSAAPSGARCPSGYPIKANISAKGSHFYYEPKQGRYKDNKAEFCFTNTAAAESAGFSRGR
jgi:micrococcal nuclease